MGLRWILNWGHFSEEIRIARAAREKVAPLIVGLPHIWESNPCFSVIRLFRIEVVGYRQDTTMSTPGQNLGLPIGFGGIGVARFS